jgi:hypothetical protein
MQCGHFSVAFELRQLLHALDHALFLSIGNDKVKTARREIHFHRRKTRLDSCEPDADVAKWQTQRT